MRHATDEVDAIGNPARCSEPSQLALRRAASHQHDPCAGMRPGYLRQCLNEDVDALVGIERANEAENGPVAESELALQIGIGPLDDIEVFDVDCVAYDRD